ncbi:MAG: DUF885 domain-containing protein [Candidatus Meridianibacter frigidus]|nr:MAG: DUF885 domain-containing protein [Candidatus Eremiobacteraeota bacterium]
MRTILRQFVVGALLLALFATNWSAVRAAPAQPNADAELYALARAYFDRTWRDNPVAATNVGLHMYDDRLGSYTAAAFRARIDSAQTYLNALRAIRQDDLSPEAGYDFLIFRSRLEATLLSLQTEQDWRHSPSFYTGAASNAVFSLIKRDFAPLDARMRDAIVREHAIPELLRQGAQNITTVDATTAQIESADVKGAAVFFSTTVPQAFASVSDSSLHAHLQAANDAVLAAIGAYSARMEAGPFAHPRGTFAIGPRIFARRLQLQELFPISLAQYEAVGVRALADTKSQFVAVAKQIDPAKSPQEVATEIGADHPAAEQLLGTAQEDLSKLRAFVQERHIVTLPPEFDIKVVPTPVFARQTTFASMDSPGPLETVATQAYYNVTPVEDSWAPARKESHLSFFNNYYRPIVSAHEVMPGHYVNFALNKHEKLSIIRKLMSSPSYAEGWAHYDEQMMVDEGWGDGNPKVRLAQLQGALLREARYLVGLREHTQGMTVDEATKFFEENAFVGPEPAHREALRGTQDPLYGYYTLGKLELLKLREDYHRKVGSAFTLQKFHDAFLAHGDPPIAITRKELLGKADDGKLL